MSKRIFLTVFLLVFTMQIEGRFTFSGSEGSLRIANPTAKVLVDDSSIFSQTGAVIDVKSLSSNFVPGLGITNLPLQEATLKLGQANIFVSSGSLSLPNNILLTNGSSVVFDKEVVQESINFIVPSGCSVTFSGPMNFDGTLILEDSTSVANLSLQSAINFVIHANGGTIRLLNNLTVDKNYQLASSVVFDLQGHELTYRNDIGVPVTFTSGGTVSFPLESNINAPLTFANTNGELAIFGSSGQGLNIGPLGSFNVLENCILGFHNANLHGLTGWSMFNLFDSTSSPGVANFYSTNLHLAGSFQLNSGVFQFFDNHCTIAGDNLSFFSINNPNTRLIVNGGVLSYLCTSDQDPLPFPFLPYDNNSIAYLNGGRIGFTSTQDSLVIDSVVSNGSTVVIKDHLALSTTNKIAIANSDSANAKTITIDGLGLIWDFKTQGTGLITIGPNVGLTISNVILRDFRTSSVSFGQYSSLVFGPGVTIEFAANEIISWPLVFQADATIKSSKSNLYFIQPQHLLTPVPGTTITFDQCSLVLQNTNAFSTGASNTICLKDSSVDVKGQDFTITSGNVIFQSAVQVYSNSGRGRLIFESSGQMTIASGATLTLGPNIDFVYDPDSSNDTSPAQTKRHFVMEDFGSKIILDRLTFDTKNKGLALEQGVFIIKNTCTLKNTATNNLNDVEISNLFLFESFGAGKLILEGKFRNF